MSQLIQPEVLCLKCMNILPDENEACPHCGFLNNSAKEDTLHLPPYTILKGQYMIGLPMGEGGFGVTYSAYDLLNEQRVAIKELFLVGTVRRQGVNVVLVDTSERGRVYYNECQEKFQQEAVALSALKDKSGVVDIRETFKENGTGYIVMEYLEGDNLLQYLKKNGGKISFKETFELLGPVMKSMIEIHRTGIIHRDISPDNIIYIPDQNMKILDFGSVKFTTKGTNSVVVLKKDGYTPPEQYSSGYLIGPWMDVYAMSAMIYRCITGKKPKASIMRQDDQDLDDPSNYCDDVPAAAAKVLKKGLALRVEDRYQDMWEFYNALNETVPQENPEPNPQDDPEIEYLNLVSKLEAKSAVLSSTFVIDIGLLILIIVLIIALVVRSHIPL